MGGRGTRQIAAALAALAYIPLLFTHPGMVGADTKAYLYLDPGRLLSSAPVLWDPHTGMGTVTHQNIGYLLPMGPWYWAFHAAGVPMWIAQRLWTGTLLFTAGLGVLVLLRAFGWRAVGAGVAAVAYMLTPYVLEYEARISAILMPWSGLPWMVLLTARAVRRGGWRDPALFAVVTALVGGVNASSLIFAGLAPVLWLPFAVWGTREAALRRAVAAALRIGLLSALASLWWIAGLSVQGGYGLDVLRYTETVEVVARTGVASEAVRGLGNWFFYGRDAVAAWVQPAVDFTQWGWLLAVSFAVPVAAFAAAAVVRWRHKAYFATLLVVGTIVVVGVHPFAHPSAFGALLRSFATGSSAGLALRSVGRAAPLVALGSAALLGAAVHAAWDRRPPAGVVVAVGFSALAVADMTPLFIGQFVDDNLQRPEAIPAYWKQAAAYLDAQGNTTRVLQLPGQDFSHFTWGATLDPLLPGIMNRPSVSRELVPTGGPASADLLRALDRRLQEGVLDPTVIAPVARRMGAGDVVLASDLEWQRYGTPRPRPTWSLFTSAGLNPTATFGPRVADGPAVAPIDEKSLGTPVGAPDPPAVAVYPVPSVMPIVHTEAASTPIVLAGDGEGFVDAASAGLLAGDSPVLYAGTLDTSAGGYRPALAAGAELVLTDSNRRRAQRWGTIRETYGYTETAGEQPLVADASDARLPVLPGAGDDAATVAEERGVRSVRATSYGNNVTYTPAQRPDQAVDGNPNTAWVVGAFGDVIGQAIEVDLQQPVTTGTVNLQQPFGTGVPAPPGQPARTAAVEPPGTRFITRVTLHFDSGPDVTVDLGPASRRAGGQTVRFPARTFGSVRITIDATNLPRVDRRSDNGVGFSEIRIGSPSLVVDEVDRLPTDLLQRTGTASQQHELVVLLSRDRADPSDPVVPDREPAMARTFTLPVARSFAVGGTARVSALAPDQVVDRLLGGPADQIVNSSGRLPGDLAARSAMAIDGNPATAWSPARGTDQVGSWIRVDARHPIPLDHVAMQVVADGRHSVPTRLRVQVDNQPDRIVDLPPVADGRDPGAVAAVPFSLPGVTATDHVLITVDAVRSETSQDPISNQPVELPVGIAELGLPGIAAPADAPTVPAGCRSDLMTVDGQPFAVRVSGTTAAASARQGLTVSACQPLSLSAGSHVIRTVSGRLTGIDLDQLVLASAPGGSADAALGATPVVSAPGGPTDAALGATPVAPAPAVRVLSSSSTAARVQVGPGAGWLVLGESLNAGWTARVEGGRSLGAPTLVDGYANGWNVAGPVTVDLRWTPQTRVWAGIGVSAATVLLCLLLALRPAGGRLLIGDGMPVLAWPWDRRRRPRARWIAIAAGLTALFVAPWAALVVAGGAAIAVAWRRGRAVIAAGSVLALAVASVSVVHAQVTHHYPLVLEWPQHFEWAGRVAALAVALFATAAALG